jgi:hypothetical protein
VVATASSAAVSFAVLNVCSARKITKASSTATPLASR